MEIKYNDRLSHQEAVREFVTQALSYAGEHIKHSIILNDDSDEEFTAYEVQITNSTNSKNLSAVLQSNGEIIELLVGDEFYPVSKLSFVVQLLLWEFLTLSEE